MAGGSGTRFWPLSRQARPKQLLRLAGDRTLLRQAYERVVGLAGPERVLVVTTLGHVGRVYEELPEVPVANVVAEPCGRNTAPCALMAALCIREMDPGATMGLFPADHVIGREDDFRRIVAGAAAYLARGGGTEVVTFGLVPRRPETGYGYIETGEEVPGAPVPLWRVRAFTEKPPLERARQLVASGRWLWNSGIFVVRVGRLVDLVAEHLPALHATLVRAMARPRERRAQAVADAYPRLEAISLDTGVMEKTPGIVVAPVDVPWSDIGSWAALSEVLGADGAGNVTVGEGMVLDGQRCVVYSPGRTAVVYGLSDVVVVQTDDAVLVCPRERSQEIRHVVAALRERGKGELL